MIRIRRACPDDYSDLVRLRRWFVAEGDALQPELARSPKGSTERTLKNWLGDGDTVVLVALDGEEAIGYIHMYPGGYLGEDPEAVRSEELFVVPWRRGSSAALRLWKATEDINRDIAPVSFQICVTENNKSVQRLMERRGFRRVASIYQQRVEEKSHGQGKRTVEVSQEVHRPGAVESGAGSGDPVRDDGSGWGDPAERHDPESG